MNIHKLPPARTRFSYEYELVAKMAEEVVATLESDLAIFDWYAGVRVDATSFMDGMLIQVHVRINETLFKMIIDGAPVKDCWEVRFHYDDIGTRHIYSFPNFNAQTLVRDFHHHHRAMIGMEWFKLV